MNFDRVLYSPVYRIEGTSVTLTIRSTIYPPVGQSLSFLDKTSGVSLGGPVEIETTRPAAVARVSDILALGLSLDDLDGALLSMNSKDWRITSQKPMPSPSGENDGEVYLFLEKA